MYHTDIAVAIANFICYASPNKTVLSSDDYELKGNEILYPPNIDAYKTQMFTKLDTETQTLMTNLWSELKIEGSNNYGVYIGLALVVIVIVVFIVYSIQKKKRRNSEY